MERDNVRLNYILKNDTKVNDLTDIDEALLPIQINKELHALFIEVAKDSIRTGEILEITVNYDGEIFFNKEKAPSFDAEDFFIEVHRRSS